jgi:hypothetical protein
MARRKVEGNGTKNNITPKKSAAHTNNASKMREGCNISMSGFK